MTDNLFKELSGSHCYDIMIMMRYQTSMSSSEMASILKITKEATRYSILLLVSNKLMKRVEHNIDDVEYYFALTQLGTSILNIISRFVTYSKEDLCVKQ